MISAAAAPVSSSIGSFTEAGHNRGGSKPPMGSATEGPATGGAGCGPEWAAVGGALLEGLAGNGNGLGLVQGSGETWEMTMSPAAVSLQQRSREPDP